MRLTHLTTFTTIFIFFFVLTTAHAQYYWVGGSGNWSDFSNHWATSSGGNTFQASAPSSTDNVIFDANSFSVNGQTVTMDAGQGDCLSMNWTGVQFNPSFVSTAPAVLNIYGSLTLSPDMTCNLRFLEFESDVAGNTITTSGTSLGSNSVFRLRGDGEWNLADVLTVNDVQMESGTFNSNGNTINCGFSFIVFSNRAKEVNLGNSTLNIQQWRTRGSNTTFKMFDATVVTQSFYSDEEDTGPYTYGNLVMTDGGLIRGTSTYNTINITTDIFPQTVRLESGITVTCQQLLLGGTRRAPLEIYAEDDGIQATFSQAIGTVSGSNLILKDIHATGGAVFTADQTEDQGNNTGWNITPVTIQDYYWIGNSGDWTDTDHWVTTSGGSNHYDDYPTRYDNIFFDGNSISEDNSTITVDTVAPFFNLDFTGVTNSPSINASFGASMDTYGSVNITDQVTMSINSLRFRGRKNGNTVYLSSEGQVSNIAFWGKGEWTINSDVICSTFSVFDGTVSTNGMTITCGFTFKQGNFNNVTLNLGSSEIFTGQFSIQDRKTIFDAGTSHIHASSIFGGNGFKYHEVSLSGSPTVNDQNTFDILTIEPGTSASFEADSTQKIIQTLNLNGEPAQPISISSTESGTQATFSLGSGTVDGIYLVLKDMNATGGAVFNATQTIDNGNNTGWNITEIIPLDFFWVGGTGDWSDSGNHWAKTSGGNEFYTFAPGPLDDVFFDAKSFSDKNQIVTIDIPQVNCHDLNWANATNNPSFIGINKIINVFGSLAYTANMSVDITNYNFLSESGATLDFGDVSNPGNNSFLLFDGSGSWVLQDSMTTREFHLKSGSFDTDDHGMHVDFRTIFSSTSEKTLDLGSSNVFTRSLSWNDIDGKNLTLNGQNSHITCSSTFAARPQINEPSVEINLNDLRFIANGIDNGLIFGEISLNTLTFDAGTTIKLQAGVTLQINRLVAKGAENNDITLFSSSDGVQAIISQPTDTVEGEYLKLKDIRATGGAVFNARNSIDNGNVTGWTFFGQAQIIDFPQIDDAIETSSQFDISATASSGLDVTLELIAGPATLEGNTVTLMGAGEIRIKASQPGNINFNPAPSVINTFCSIPTKPTITIDDSDTTLLISSRTEGNQWFLDGNLISGATGPSYAAVQSGSYTVQIVLGACFSEMSDPIDLLITSTDDWLLNDNIELWPNPAKDAIFLKVNDAQHDTKYFIYDINGRVCQHGIKDLIAGDKIRIDISQLDQGVYILFGMSSEGQFRKRFIKGL